MTNISKATQHSGTTNPIVFFGTEDFSLIALNKLIEAGFPIAAVVTKPDSKKGRGQKLVEPPVKVLAHSHNIPVLQPHKLSEITDHIIELQPVTGVLVSYGKIIPQSIIDLFTPGIINLHPSLLPRYRGPSPIESAIANGDQETGITIMQLSARMDAGPMYAFSPLELTGRETRPQLYETLGELGSQVLIATLPGIISGKLTPTPQDEDGATYCQLLSKEDAWIDPTSLTAAEVERRVRAHLGFPKSKLRVLGHDIIILHAHVSSKQKTPLDIECSDGAFVSIDELIAPSGKTMSADAFLRGYAEG